MRDIKNKLRLLALMDLLRNETDENHPVSVSEIVKRITANDIPCDRRNISADIPLLRSCGYEIADRMQGREHVFYCPDREFTSAETKILTDAVRAATFITPDQSDELISKISRLGGSFDTSEDCIISYNVRKHSNADIYENVQSIEKAIRRNRQVSFLYFDLNIYRHKKYRKEKRRYVVEPLALVYHEDNYYLVTWSSKYHGITNYRIDRMDSVKIEDKILSDEAIAHLPDTEHITEQSFKMYTGELTDVTLRFPGNLIGCVFDKFGESLKIRKLGENSYSTTVSVQVSPTFFGWVFQFAGQMEIIGPETVIVEYAQSLSGIKE